jgi:hypothetical protein
MAPLVFHHLARIGALAHIPRAVAEDFGRQYRQTLISNRRAQAALLRILTAFEAASVAAMPLKGLALAQRCYEHFALRPMSDLDLLVRREDITRATAALRALGYRASGGMGRPTGFYSMTSAVVVYDKAGALPVEVHWELFNNGVYRVSLPASQVWRRARAIDLLGWRIEYLDLRDELRYLCVHAAAEHQLDRLIWLVDIAELARSLPSGWDWSDFVSETIAARLALPVAAALVYCHEALGLRLPADTLARLSAASSSENEQVAWTLAQADLLSEDWMRVARAGLRGAPEWAIYVRGVLLPRTPTLVQLYGGNALSWRGRVRAYARHLRHTVPALIGSMGGGSAS